LIVLIVLLAIAVPIGVVAVALALGDGDDDYIADPEPSYTKSTYTPEPLPTVTLPSDFPTIGPTEGPTPEPTETSDPQQPNGVNYAQVARANKLYQAGQMRSVGCRESGTAPSNEAGARTYYRAVADCLERSWPSLMSNAGMTFREPTILAWTGSVDTPCGFINGSVSFYCPPNETIYLEWSGDAKMYNQDSSNAARAYARMAATHTVAHEYGHHIQNLVGIMRAYSELRHAAGSRDKELELSRRVELQASCLADVFLGANQPSYPITGQNRTAWVYLVEHSGDNYNPAGIRDHGDKQSHAFWAKRGFQSENPSSCNTFTASPSQVY
jgi:uncharacterized protein